MLSKSVGLSSHLSYLLVDRLAKTTTSWTVKLEF